MYLNMNSIMILKRINNNILVRLCLLLLFLTLSMTVKANDNIDSDNIISKQQGDSLYMKGEYEKAVSIYLNLINKYGHASQLYYNIGNCFYKLGNVHKSILNYERALKLSPGDNDIRENLALARGRTVDKVTHPSEMFFVTWWKNLTMIMSVDQWGGFAILSFVLSLIGVLFYVLISNIAIRKIGVCTFVTFFLIMILSNFAAVSLRNQTLEHLYAIVSAPVRSVKSSPNEESVDLFVIHEGAKVEILDNSIKGWCEIKLEEGKIGWIPADYIEII